MNCRARSAILAGLNVDAGHHLEQLAVDMRRASDAGRREIDLAGIGFGISNELGNGRDRH